MLYHKRRTWIEIVVFFVFHIIFGMIIWYLLCKNSGKVELKILLSIGYIFLSVVLWLNRAFWKHMLDKNKNYEDLKSVYVRADIWFTATLVILFQIIVYALSYYSNGTICITRMDISFIMLLFFVGYEISIYSYFGQFKKKISKR